MRAFLGPLCLLAGACTALLGAVLGGVWVSAMSDALGELTRDSKADLPGPIVLVPMGMLLLGVTYLVVAALLLSAALLALRWPSAATTPGGVAVALSLILCLGDAWIGAVHVFGIGLGPYISRWLTAGSIAVIALVPVLSITGIALLPKPSAADHDPSDS